MLKKKKISISFSYIYLLHILFFFLKQFITYIVASEVSYNLYAILRTRLDQNTPFHNSNSLSTNKHSLILFINMNIDSSSSSWCLDKCNLQISITLIIKVNSNEKRIYGLVPHKPLNHIFPASCSNRMPSYNWYFHIQ